MNNYEKIISMSVEDLAVLLSDVDCRECPLKYKCEGGDTDSAMCYRYWLRYLKEECHAAGNCDESADIQEKLNRYGVAP